MAMGTVAPAQVRQLAAGGGGPPPSGGAGPPSPRGGGVPTSRTVGGGAAPPAGSGSPGASGEGRGSRSRRCRGRRRGGVAAVLSALSCCRLLCLAVVLVVVLLSGGGCGGSGRRGVITRQSLRSRLRRGASPSGPQGGRLRPRFVPGRGCRPGPARRPLFAGPGPWWAASAGPDPRGGCARWWSGWWVFSAPGRRPPPRSGPSSGGVEHRGPAGAVRSRPARPGCLRRQHQGRAQDLAAGGHGRAGCGRAGARPAPRPMVPSPGAPGARVRSTRWPSTRPCSPSSWAAPPTPWPSAGRKEYSAAHSRALQQLLPRQADYLAQPAFSESMPASTSPRPKNSSRHCRLKRTP